MNDFNQRNIEMCDKMGQDLELQKTADKFIDLSYEYEYPYHFTWMGMPIIQYPADIIAFQEVVYRVKPDYIIETGIARGGSMIFYASLLELMGNQHGKIIGVDIDIREHNKTAILNHPLSKRVEMVEGSSIDMATFQKVKQLIPEGSKVVVILDSYHTHDHVLKELELYSEFVAAGSYIIVTGTTVESVPNKYAQRPWGNGNNPYTATKVFLEQNSRFVLDETFDKKLLITDCKQGFLKCVAEK